MFKFLKSKKGFTLVELMIVVVIMAILVAVAVPIYSAVTRNAKTKACAANIREITAQLNNMIMSDGTSTNNAGFSFTISTTDNKVGTVNKTQSSQSGAATAITDAQKASIEALFQAVPACPAGGTYDVNVAAGTATTNGKITVTCSQAGETLAHD